MYKPYSLHCFGRIQNQVFETENSDQTLLSETIIRLHGVINKDNWDIHNVIIIQKITDN